MVFDKLFAWRKKRKLYQTFHLAGIQIIIKASSKSVAGQTAIPCSNNSNIMKVSMPFLTTCVTMTNKISFMKEMTRKAGFIFSRVLK